MARQKPNRGEIWLINLNPTLGREQRGIRPCLIVSANPLNHGPAELTIVLPITSRDKRIPAHVQVSPPEGGLHQRSFIKCEDVRSVSTIRLLERWGKVERQTMEAVSYRLRMLLDL